MENLPTKITGDQYTAAEFNVNQNERENAVTDSGQTLGVDQFQLSRAMSINAGGADYYSATGGPTAYVLTSVGSLRSPSAYYNGQRIRFRPPTNNTGGATVNVGGVGVVSILKEDGVSALLPGDLTTSQDAECRYSISAAGFLLKAAAPDATQTSTGVSFLGDQRIILSNNSVDPNSDIDFGGGRFTFDDGSGEAIVSALTKQLDSTWVAGNNQGGLDTGSKAIDTWYHSFAIHNPVNGNSDYLFSTSASSPTLPAGYTKKRRIGSLRTDSSNNIIGFFQKGKRFQYKARITDINGVNPGVTGTLVAITTPLGVETQAMLLAHWSTGAARYLLITSPSEDNNAASSTFCTLSSSGIRSHIELLVKTNTSSQIRHRANLSVTPALYLVFTLGWIDESLED